MNKSPNVPRLFLGFFGRANPQAEAANLDGILAEVHAEEVIFEDVAVEVEELHLAAQVAKASATELCCSRWTDRRAYFTLLKNAEAHHDRKPLAPLA